MTYTWASCKQDPTFGGLVTLQERHLCDTIVTNAVVSIAKIATRLPYKTTWLLFSLATAPPTL
jgi:hypothetical protein